MKSLFLKIIPAVLTMLIFTIPKSAVWAQDNTFDLAAFSESTVLYQANVYGVGLEPKKSMLTLAMKDSVVVLLLPKGKMVFNGHYGPSLKLESAGLSKDGKNIIGGFGHDVYFWDIADKDSKPTLLRYNEITDKQAGAGLVDFALGPNGKYAASSASASPGAARLVLWNLQKQKIEHSLALMTDNNQKRDNGGEAIAFSEDGKRVAVALQPENEVWVYDIAKAEVLHKISIDNASFETALAWSPDGNYLASGSLRGAIYFWDIENGKVLHTLKGHSKYITDLVISADGQMLISSSQASKSGSSGSVRLWKQK
jgi:WD40 repeat protein